MNFTREPIIETIITSKDGYKLIVRSTKVSGGEEYSVDAVEIVSFGNALFFRSQERPKPFFIPVSDFEVIEAKETRVVLKAANLERSIKIGGGKEASLKTAKEKEEEPQEVEQRLEKKRERRRHRRRKSSVQTEEETPQPAVESSASKGGGVEDETDVSSSLVPKLIPPPPGLISEKYFKVPEEAAPAPEGDVLPESLADDTKVKEKSVKQPRKWKKAKRQGEDKTVEDAKETVSKEAKPNEETPSQVKNDKSEGGSSSVSEERGGADVSRTAVEERETVTSTSFSSFDPTNFTPFGKIW